MKVYHFVERLVRGIFAHSNLFLFRAWKAEKYQVCSNYLYKNKMYSLLRILVMFAEIITYFQMLCDFPVNKPNVNLQLLK
jgi:hypothetical protein